MMASLMRLKKGHIERIAQLIFQGLQKKDLISLKVTNQKIISKIIDVITRDMQAEDRLDQDTRKMMDQYRTQIESGQVDERKIFLMIKKQLAKERKMIL